VSDGLTFKSITAQMPAGSSYRIRWIYCEKK